MAEKEKTPKQVMDVSKPGKTPADASARPVIVGHKPQVQDPMVNSAEDTNPEVSQEEPVVASPAASKKVIAPLSEQEKPAEIETASEEPNTPVADDAEKTTPEAPAEDTSAPETPSDTNVEESSDAAVVDAVADQVGLKKKEDQVSEEDKKRQEELNKLVAEKKYFVPIGKAHRKKNRAVLGITLFLALVLVGMLAAIDAKILEAGFTLPFDLIK